MKTRLKEIRKARGYTSARAFAEYLGMSENTLRKYEQSERNINLTVACRLCDALGCTLDELAGRDSRHPLEKELVSILANITPEGQKQLLIFARGIAQSYPKSNSVKVAS